MAEIGGSYVCKGTEGMNLIERQQQQPAVKNSTAVRVKLERTNCDVSDMSQPQCRRAKRTRRRSGCLRFVSRLTPVVSRSEVA
jgi:hypothetical protein